MSFPFGQGSGVIGRPDGNAGGDPQTSERPSFFLLPKSAEGGLRCALWSLPHVVNGGDGTRPL